MCKFPGLSKPLINDIYYYGKYKLTENPFLTSRNLKTIWVNKVYICIHIIIGMQARYNKQVHRSMWYSLHQKKADLLGKILLEGL